MSDAESGFDSELLDYIATHSIGNSYGFDDSGSKIAKKLMIELVKSGYASFILLKDDQISKWWSGIVTKASTAIADRKEKQRLYDIKIAAYDRLSPEERKILSIRKPVKPRG